MNPTTPPMNPSANEEEISLLIGTLQVPRGRSASKISPKDVIAHRELSRSNSETAAKHPYRYFKDILVVVFQYHIST